MKIYRYLVLLFCLGMLLAGCNLPADSSAGIEPTSQGSSPSPLKILPAAATPTPPWTNTPVPSRTPSPTTALPSATPTISLTPTITPSPTFAFPWVTAIMQANCRYGPGTAYLYAHGMYPGDGGAVWGRNSTGTWLWIQPDNIHYQCWISTSVVEVQGDIFSVYVAQVRLPYSYFYYPPEDVQAARAGDEVTVTWSRVPMTVDDARGYLLEVTVCLDGSLMWKAVHTDDTFFTFTDEAGCDGDSGGLLYTVDKHGYSDPVEIPWP
jgi:hypothetical protein